jgi:hypothetical protein
MQRAAFEGLARAIERFDVAVKDRDPTNTFIPLFELLNWAVALDERTGQDWHRKGEPLRWALRVGHDLGDPVLIKAGADEGDRHLERLQRAEPYKRSTLSRYLSRYAKMVGIGDRRMSKG